MIARSTPERRHAHRLLAAALVACSLAVVLPACGGSSQEPQQITNRIWVSRLPEDPKQPFTQFFVLQREGSDEGVGLFIQGSRFRGTHDAFRYSARSESAGTITFLQDERSHRVAGVSCSPAETFDYCLDLSGDPRGARRYYSRREWERDGAESVAAMLGVTPLDR